MADGQSCVQSNRMHEQLLTSIWLSCRVRVGFCSLCYPAFELLQVLTDNAGLTLPWRCCCAQVHLFIFYMAITHILGGILLIALAALRIRCWRRWTEHSDHVALE